MALRFLRPAVLAAALTAGTALADPGFYSGDPNEISGWTAVYFEPREFASKGNGQVHVRKDLVAALDRVRRAVGHPIRITSAYRDPAHNARVGGARFSRHMLGDAVDIDIHGLSGSERYRLMWHLLAEGFTSFGSYARAPNMLHADRRPSARMWRHGGGNHPDWFHKALADWGWTRDRGPTRGPSAHNAQR